MELKKILILIALFIFTLPTFGQKNKNSASFSGQIISDVDTIKLIARFQRHTITGLNSEDSDFIVPIDHQGPELILGQPYLPLISVPLHFSVSKKASSRMGTLSFEA